MLREAAGELAAAEDMMTFDLRSMATRKFALRHSAQTETSPKQQAAGSSPARGTNAPLSQVRQARRLSPRGRHLVPGVAQRSPTRIMPRGCSIAAGPGRAQRRFRQRNSYGENSKRSVATRLLQEAPGVSVLGVLARPTTKAPRASRQIGASSPSWMRPRSSTAASPSQTAWNSQAAASMARARRGAQPPPAARCAPSGRPSRRRRLAAPGR